ncbi:hypothetical protein NE591_15010, partial [Adlercreutzia sp. DFI.6.23]|nr:hypothetical protein [Adlercreutzia sp. DFI.6.23]
LIEQVAGRAGRAELDGRVMVQTYEADDVAIRAAATYNRGMFLRAELPKRKLLGYPPYVRLFPVRAARKHEPLPQQGCHLPEQRLEGDAAVFEIGLLGG